MRRRVILRRSTVLDPDLPFLDAPKPPMRQPKRGETLRCIACDCTWENSPSCWLCGATGLTVTTLARLRMHRALHPVEDMGVSA